MGVDQVHRLLQGLDPHHTQHRAKNFFLVNHHAGFDVVEQARAQKITVFMAGHTHAAAIHHQRGTFFHALVHIAQDLFEMRPGHQRTHVHAGRGAGADLHFGNLDLQARDHGVGCGVAHRHHQRNRHATFAARTIGCAHQGAHGVADVGIGHQHRVVFGAAQRLHPLAVGATGGVNVFGNRRGAHKTDCLDARIGQQRVHRLFVAVDHIEYTRWQAGLQRQFGNAQRAGRVALGRFEHKGVAAGHRHGPHPQGHHGREVEGGDAGGHAQCLEFAPRINGRADVFAVLTLEQFGGIRGVFDVLDAALQLAQRVAQHLAVLGGDQGAELVGVLFQQHLEVAHHAGALERRRVAPGRKSRLSAGYGLLHGSLVGQQHALFSAAGGGVEDVL